MLKTPMKTWFAFQMILFRETLEYWNVILIFYKWQHTIHLSFIVLVFRTCVIVQAIIDTFLPVVKLCVLNQSVRYWLLLNALYFAFTLCIAMKIDVVRIQALNQSLTQGDFDSKLQ